MVMGVQTAVVSGGGGGGDGDDELVQWDHVREVGSASERLVIGGVGSAGGRGRRGRLLAVHDRGRCAGGGGRGRGEGERAACRSERGQCSRRAAEE
eukprot:2782395-Rhodomonas_salina.1